MFRTNLNFARPTKNTMKRGKALFSRKLGRGIAASLILLGLANAVDFSIADDISWKPGTTGDWTNAANWDGGVLPTIADTARITSGTVTGANSSTAGKLILGDGASSTAVATLNVASAAPYAGLQNIELLKGGTLKGTAQAADQSGTILINGGTLDYSGQKYFSGSTNITLNEGAILANEFRVGSGTGSNGFLTVNGGALTTTSWVSIGENGTGTFTLNEGAVTVGNLNQACAFVLGGPDGTGSFVMNGGTLTARGSQTYLNGSPYSIVLGWGSNSGSMKINGGELTSTYGFLVGGNGSGTVVQKGGTVNALGVNGLTIKANSSYTLSGGSLYATKITGNLVQEEAGILKAGSSTLNITGSAELNGKIDASALPSSYAAQYTLVNATAGITGAPTVFSNANTSMYDLNSVAVSGNSVTVNVDSSIYFWNGGATAGAWSDTAKWLTNGAAATSLSTTDNNVFITNGTVTAADNAAAKNLVLGDGASSTAVATLNVASAAPYAGLQNIELLKGGTLKGTAQAADQSGTILINGGTLDYSGQKYFSGSTNITLNEGAILANEFRVGSGTGSNGFLTVNGGALTTTSWVSIGENGTGTFTLNEGAVTVGNLNQACAFVLGGPDGTGSFVMNGGTLTARGSQTYLNGSPYSIVLGWGTKSGSMEINGGELTSTYGFLVGGNGSGTVEQTGGIVFANGVNGLNIKANSSYALSGGTLYATKITNADRLSVTGGVLEANSITGLLNQTGGAISPGGIGAINTTTINNNYTLNKGVSYQIDIDPSTPLTSFAGVPVPLDGFFASDMILVQGDATVNGLLDFVLPENYVDDYSQQFVVLAATGDITLGDDLTSSWFGLSLLNVPGVGNALVANRVPEPATWTLLLLGVGGLTLLRNRRKVSK